MKYIETGRIIIGAQVNRFLLLLLSIFDWSMNVRKLLLLFIIIVIMYFFKRRNQAHHKVSARVSANRTIQL